MALGATFDPEIVQAVGVAVAKEALAKHFHAPRNGSRYLSFEGGLAETRCSLNRHAWDTTASFACLHLAPSDDDKYLCAATDADKHIARAAWESCLAGRRGRPLLLGTAPR